MSNKTTLRIAFALLFMVSMTSALSPVYTFWQNASSEAAPLKLVAGTYSLPLMINSSVAFTAGLTVTVNNANFKFLNGMAIVENATTAFDYLGCDSSVADGVYQVSFSFNVGNYAGPGSVWVQVVHTPITLDIAPLVNFSMHLGYPTAAVGPYFDLSAYAPFSDVTITATATNGDDSFFISPPFLKLRSDYTKGGFMYHSNINTQLNSNSVFTFALSGPNAASYVLSRSTQTVNGVAKPNPNTPNQTANATYPLYTSLASSSPSLTVVAGTYSLPVSFTTPTIPFLDYVSLTVDANNWSFNPALVALPSTRSADSMLGCSAWVAAGSYNLSFSTNSTSSSDYQYLPPANLVVNVITTPISLSFGASTVNLQWQSGVSVSSAPVVFDLSAFAPYNDLTIEAVIPAAEAANWQVVPSTIQYSPSNKNGSFVVSTKANAPANAVAHITYKVSGTNAASYVISGTQTFVAVGPTGGNGGSGNGNGNGGNGGNGGNNGGVGPVNSAGGLMVSAMAIIAFTSFLLM